MEDLDIRQVIEDADFAMDDSKWSEDGEPLEDVEEDEAVDEQADDDSDIEVDGDDINPLDEDEEEGQEDEEELEDDSEDEEQDASAGFDPPPFWDAKEKESFAKAPKDVQMAILRNEQQRNTWANGIAQKTAEAEKYYAALDDVLEPYRPYLARNGLDEATAIRKFFGWQEVIEKDPLVGIIELARTYGLTRNDLVGMTDVGAGYGDDGRYEQLQEEIAALRGQLEEREQSEVIGSIEQEVSAFENATDENGNLLRPYFKTLAPQIAYVVQELKAANPYWTNAQVLEAAYSSVAREFEQRYVKPQVESNSQAFAQRRAKRIRQATSPLSSSRNGSESDNQPVPADEREALEMAARQLGFK